MKTTYKFIEFVMVDGRWVCRNRKNRRVLCEVERDNQWRQHVMCRADFDAIFSHDCTIDIGHFLQQLNEGKK